MVVALVKDGATLAEAGRRFGMTRERVRQILKSRGIAVRELAGRNDAMARWRLERVRARGPVIETMWRGGKTLPEIARTLALPERPVREVLNERVPRVQRLEEMARRQSERTRMPDEWAFQALREAAEVLGGTPTARAYDELRAAGRIKGPTSSLIAARWGWSAGCRRAGLEPNPSPSRSYSRVYSDEALRAALARVEEELGHPPSLSEYDAHRRGGDPTAVTIRHRAGGSWIRARSRYG